jgi:Fe2+ or Zn2+ uptake regulation protein
MGHLMLDRLHFYLVGIHRSRGSARDAVFLAVHRAGNGSRAELLRSLSDEDNTLSKKSFNRALDFLLEVDAVRETPGRRYEVTEPLASMPHHHFMVCKQCGRKFTFNSPRLETMLNKIADKRNFKLQSHQLELSSRCYLCKE